MTTLITQQREAFLRTFQESDDFFLSLKSEPDIVPRRGGVDAPLSLTVPLRAYDWAYSCP